MSRRGSAAGTGGGVMMMVVIIILLGTSAGRHVTSAVSGALRGTASAAHGVGSAAATLADKPKTVTAPGSPTIVTAAAAKAALAQLATLPVLKSRPTVAGYQRSCATGKACSFGPAWTDDTTAPGGHNGCDTRDDLLRSDMTHVVFVAGSTCVVASGTYAEPYTGKTVTWTKAHAGTLQVDHVVPLALAWDLGASQWTQVQRTVYANDEKTVLLLADGPANEAKGDSGPAEWMPTNESYRCTYDAKFTGILAAYHLPVTAADKAAMTTVLNACT